MHGDGRPHTVSASSARTLFFADEVAGLRKWSRGTGGSSGIRRFFGTLTSMTGFSYQGDNGCVFDPRSPPSRWSRPGWRCRAAGMITPAMPATVITMAITGIMATAIAIATDPIDRRII